MYLLRLVSCLILTILSYIRYLNSNRKDPPQLYLSSHFNIYIHMVSFYRVRVHLSYTANVRSGGGDDGPSYPCIGDMSGSRGDDAISRGDTPPLFAMFAVCA
mmetsp:Transcript_31984/g.67087  ORF Transcript_31984/g.67087 Transcript_31984/m.67087 type:complete len:102 (-) Transcript_31984:156-461(-)